MKYLAFIIILISTLSCYFPEDKTTKVSSTLEVDTSGDGAFNNASESPLEVKYIESSDCKVTVDSLKLELVNLQTRYQKLLKSAKPKLVATDKIKPANTKSLGRPVSNKGTSIPKEYY